MSTKIKIAFIIILIFVLGIILGALASRALLHNRIQKTFSMRNPVFISKIYMNIIQPDEEQAKKIKKILDAHVKQITEMRMEFSNKMRLSWESLEKEMDSILTPEQKKRLEENAPGSMRRFRNFRNRKPPFPGTRRRNIPPGPRK